MSTTNNHVSIHILGKLFTVRCPEGKRVELQEAVQHLTTHLQGIRTGIKATDLEQLLVIAALNMTNDLLAEKRAAQAEALHITERIQNLQQQVDAALIEVVGS